MKIVLLNACLNGKTTCTVPAKVIKVNQSLVKIKALGPQHPLPLFLEIIHPHPSTIVDFSMVEPAEVWHFNIHMEFIGRSFSFNSTNELFQLQSRASYIAIIPEGYNYTRVYKHILEEPKKCTLSEYFLNESAYYSPEAAQWIRKLAGQSDKELIETYNKTTEVKGWVQARAHYLNCLKKEILNRTFDSTILFSVDPKNNTEAFSIKNKVVLHNNCLILKS